MAAFTAESIAIGFNPFFPQKSLYLIAVILSHYFTDFLKFAFDDLVRARAHSKIVSAAEIKRAVSVVVCCARPLDVV